jgi:hypothetical protein
VKYYREGKEDKGNRDVVITLFFCILKISRECGWRSSSQFIKLCNCLLDFPESFFFFVLVEILFCFSLERQVKNFSFLVHIF